MAEHISRAGVENGVTTTLEQIPLVRMRGISKNFPGVRALNGVDFDLLPGEIHALAGENGSGKSTLAKILYGALKPDAGTIEINGEATTISSPGRALELGVIAISQELTLAPTLSVTENVLMGRLPRRAGLVNWRVAHRVVNVILAELGVEVDAKSRVGDLTIELQQEVEIARAVSAKSRILVLDEATSSLSEAATEHLLEKLEQLHTQGVSIIFISHRLRELYMCTQRATVLRDGNLVGTVPLPATKESELVRMMVGREIEDLFGKREISRGQPLLEVSGLTAKDGSFRDASFEAREGEIVGIAGLVGSGKTELGLALAGALPTSGDIRVRGQRVSLSSPRRAMRIGIGFIPEDRKRSAIFGPRTLQQNLIVSWLFRLGKFGLISPGRGRRMARATVHQFSIRTRSMHARIVELSGGNQQKVVLGRCFSLSPEVVVLTEPTRGIDVGAKSEVYRFIQDMAEAGTATVMISSELPELLGIADRILVMFRGEICAEFGADQSVEEQIAHVAMGGASDTEARPASSENRAKSQAGDSSGAEA